MVTFNDLPNELLIQIIQFVPLWHVGKLAFLNSRLYELAKSFLAENRHLHEKHSRIYCTYSCDDYQPRCRGILRNFIIEPRITHYVNLIGISFSRFDRIPTIPEAELELYHRACKDSPWIPDEEVPKWHHILTTSQALDPICSLLILLLPNLRIIWLDMDDTGSEFCIKSILDRLAVVCPSTPGEVRPLGRLREVRITGIFQCEIFSLLALPTVETITIWNMSNHYMDGIWDDETDRPLSNLTALVIDETLSTKGLESILRRVKALRSFKCPFIRFPPPQWDSYEKVLLKHTKHTLNKLELRTLGQDDPPIKFIQLQDFSDLKEINLSFHFLELNQGVRLAENLPDSLEKLSFHFGAYGAVPDEMASKVMDMFKMMIEDKSMRGRLSNLQEFSVLFSGSTDRYHTDAARWKDFKRACSAAGVSCIMRDKENLWRI